MERSLLVFSNTGIKIHPWPTDYRSRVKILTIDDFIPSSQYLRILKEIFPYEMRK
ncbi:hypothetical protein [Leptospira sarikeiensis]|uniref:hypothetical protein n=1 Tax=Leptospira sarikeiensis TaxID=2484943 RepID=UPI001FE98CAF